MQNQDILLETIAPRPASEVMRLTRMGCFHQHRLSFMRVLLRRLKSQNWRFETALFDIDKQGVGVAVYSAHGPKNTYSLVAFANDLAPEKRSDRVIATEWDATFTLFDGVPSTQDIARLRQNIPLQEAGRAQESELTISRANRSVRLWDHVVQRLAAGRQPDPTLVDQVGYLMRTTAVYGSGKFGAADRETLKERDECQGAFQMEMLTVFLIRAFALDLVEHMARAQGGQGAVVLDPSLRRKFGIGNSTGLGMAPFLINHPMLLNNWIAAKEEALARVRRVEWASQDAIDRFQELLPRALQNIHDWHSEHPLQVQKLAQLGPDIERLIAYIPDFKFNTPAPWNQLFIWGQKNLGQDGQELLISLMMEPYGDLIDGLSSCMTADELTGFRIDGTMSIGRLKTLCEMIYDWALKIDWAQKQPNSRAWYVSCEKLEPRLGERFDEDIAEFEQPLQPGRDAARLYKDLDSMPDTAQVAEFLMAHPEHRHSVRRCQLAARCDYAEIRDNTIDADMLPIDLLRAKLSFFGATHFDPRSDRWVRINMFRMAPFPHELAQSDPDHWTYPPLSAAE